MIFKFFEFLAKYALFGSRNIDGMKEWAMKDIFCLVNWPNRAESDEIYAKTLPYCYCFMLLMIGRRKKLRRRAKLKRTPMCVLEIVRVIYLKKLFLDTLTLMEN